MTWRSSQPLSSNPYRIHYPDSVKTLHFEYHRAPAELPLYLPGCACAQGKGGGKPLRSQESLRTRWEGRAGCWRGSLAGEGLPARTVLGWGFCPEEGQPHTEGPGSKGTWRSQLGEAKFFTKWQSYPLGTCNAQEACTSLEGASVICCVTSGKFHLSLGLGFPI